LCPLLGSILEEKNAANMYMREKDIPP